jgi:hypothetical protein
MSEPESLVLKLLREMREDMATKRDFEALKSDIAGVRSEMKSFRTDVASDLERMTERINHLNRQ